MLGERLDGYPLYSETKNISYVVSPDGISATESGTVHQWTSVDEMWNINLSGQSMTLFTAQYTGYEAFDVRLRTVVTHLRDTVGVPLVTKVSVRYVNRLVDQADIDALPSLVSPSLLGLRALGLPFLQGSTNQATYLVDSAVLQVRSGTLEPHQSVDPAIPTLPAESWVLDLDASTEVRLICDSQDVGLLASKMSDVAYDYFKAVAPHGLRELP